MDEADLNDNMFGGGPKKRAGDPMNAQNGPKNKRRVNTTPPPSRRPIGPPNSPQPSKSPPATPPPPQSDVICLDTSPKPEDSNCNDRRNVVEDIHSHVDATKTVTLPNSENNDFKDESKNTIDEQLKRLIVRNRKNSLLNNEKMNSISEDSSAPVTSPILSILQTSLEDMDDKDNEELAMINNNDIPGHNAPKFLNTASSSPILQFHNHVGSSPSLHTRSPTDVEARLELQSANSTRVRLEVWKAIRNRSGWCFTFDFQPTTPVGKGF